MFNYVLILNRHSLILLLPRAHYTQICLRETHVLEALSVSLSFSFVYVDFRHKLMWTRW